MGRPMFSRERGFRRVPSCRERGAPSFVRAGKKLFIGRIIPRGIEQSRPPSLRIHDTSIVILATFLTRSLLTLRHMPTGKSGSVRDSQSAEKISQIYCGTRDFAWKFDKKAIYLKYTYVKVNASSEIYCT